MVDYGYVTVAGQDKVAVHAVDSVEVGGDRVLRCGEALSYCGTSEDATGARRVPEGAGVGVEVWCYVF